MSEPDYAVVLDLPYEEPENLSMADVETVSTNDDSTERDCYSPNTSNHYSHGSGRRSPKAQRRTSLISAVSERVEHIAKFSFATARWGESLDHPWFGDKEQIMTAMWPWIRVMFISLAIGLVEYIPVMALVTIMDWKIVAIQEAYSANGLGQMLGVNLTFGVVQISLAAFMCLFIARMAAGSGIPGIISYLASGYIPHKELLSFKTVLVKIPAIVFTIGGGLVVGREGPAIHIGTGTADIIFRWFDKLAPAHLKLVKQTENGEVFDGESAHEIAILGAACGFAAAFNAPIGGMLYIWEEMSMHWSNIRHNTMGARILLGVCLSTLVLRLMIATVSREYNIQFNSIVIFDDEVYADESWEYMDLPVIILLGIVCGVMSGCMGRGAIWVHKMNKEKLKESWQKFAFVIAAVILTILLFTLVPYFFNNCMKDTVYGYDDQIGDEKRRRLGGGGTRDYLQFNCPYGEYNELASFTLVGNEGMLRHLMARDGNRIKSVDLIVFLVLYIPMFLLPFGAMVPSGNFVPTLLIGAAVGRIFGQLVWAWKGTTKPGVYAVIGAAGMLGGWTRTMMAIVVTMSEITGDVSLTLPMIIVITISRQIASCIAHHSYAHSLVDSLDKEDFVTDPKKWFNSRNKFRRKSTAGMEAGTMAPTTESEGSGVTGADPMVPPNPHHQQSLGRTSLSFLVSTDEVELVAKRRRSSGGGGSGSLPYPRNNDNYTQEEVEDNLT